VEEGGAAAPDEGIAERHQLSLRDMRNFLINIS